MVVKSADRVIKILEAVGSSNNGITHGELADVLGIPKSSLTFLLSNLVDLHYLNYDKLNKLYMLGWKLLVLTGRFLSNLDIVRVGRPIIHELVAEINEDVEIAVMKDCEILFVYKKECLHPLKYSVEIGDRAPAYATACGKAILANLSEDEISEYLFAINLDPLTKNTITEPEMLRNELENIRSRGIAYSNEEFQSGICGIAAPIYDFIGNISGSIVVTVPGVRFDDEKKNLIEPKLRKASMNISRQLGYDSHDKVMYNA